MTTSNGHKAVRIPIPFEYLGSNGHKAVRIPIPFEYLGMTIRFASACGREYWSEEPLATKVRCGRCLDAIGIPRTSRAVEDIEGMEPPREEIEKHDSNR